MALGIIAAYIKNNNTVAWGRARRIGKYKLLVGLVIGEKELIDIANNTWGEDEPMTYAILRMRKQESLQAVLEYYNTHERLYAFLYGAGKNNAAIYRNTSGCTTWTGARSLWALLNKIDKEHFDAAIQKTGEPKWLKTLQKDGLRTSSFVPLEKGGRSGNKREYREIVSLYNKKMAE